MYLPEHFAENRVEPLHALMRANPFATLLTHGAEGMEADHLPLHLATAGSTCGILQGHVARSNPVWQRAADSDVLVIFHGPQTYVTPSWYPTKREHGRAVPTWNYVVVHARGRLRAIDDAAWLRRNLESLVAHHEQEFPEPWKIADAPADYIEKMLGAIVGIEIDITGLKGKWKTSQNQPPENRAGVVAGLRRLGTDDASAMADLIAGTLTP